MEDSVESFRTSRLVAARLRADDWAPLFRLHRDRRVMATLGGLQDPEQTRSALRQHIDHWERHGFGLWAFRQRSTNAFVGRAGLRHVEVGGAAEIELAYALRAEFWRRGLATEMAAAILERAFGALGLSNLVAFTLTSNRASRRVVEKLGFRYERHVLHAGLPHVLTRITARHRAAPRPGREPRRPGITPASGEDHDDTDVSAFSADPNRPRLRAPSVARSFPASARAISTARGRTASSGTASCTMPRVTASSAG